MFNQIPFTYNNPMALTPGFSSTLSNATTQGVSSSLLGKINWSSLLSNAQKTLNVVNQAIPLYYQVKPVFNNIKTLGKIGKEFTNIKSNNMQSNNMNNNSSNISSSNLNNPTNNADVTINNVPEPTFYL